MMENQSSGSAFGSRLAQLPKSPSLTTGSVKHCLDRPRYLPAAQPTSIMLALSQFKACSSSRSCEQDHSTSNLTDVDRDRLTNGSETIGKFASGPRMASSANANVIITDIIGCILCSTAYFPVASVVQSTHSLRVTFRCVDLHVTLMYRFETLSNPLALRIQRTPTLPHLVSSLKKQRTRELKLNGAWVLIIGVLSSFAITTCLITWVILVTTGG